MSNESLDQLNGFFGFNFDDNLGDFVKQQREITEIAPRMSHWANKQLHAGTQATRFFLPSLGTMLVSGDLTKLSGYVGNRLDFIVDEIVDELPNKDTTTYTNSTIEKQTNYKPNTAQ